MNSDFDALKSQAVRLPINWPMAFLLGAIVGAGIVLCVPKWGPWVGLSVTMVTTSEHDTLRADAEQAKARMDALQKERDDLVAENAKLNAQLVNRHEMSELCARWDSEIHTKDTQLSDLNRQLQRDVILAAPVVNDGSPSKSPAIDQDNASISDIRQALAALHQHIDQDCRFAG